MKTMCLCCGKEIISEDSSEIQNQWHKKCVKSFFGTNQFPEILISNEHLGSLSQRLFQKVLRSLKEKLLTVVADSFICESEKSSFMSLMTERMNRLS